MAMKRVAHKNVKVIDSPDEGSFYVRKSGKVPNVNFLVLFVIHLSPNFFIATIISVRFTFY